MEYHKKAFEILSELAPVIEELQVNQEVRTHCSFQTASRPSTTANAYRSPTNRQATGKVEMMRPELSARFIYRVFTANLLVWMFSCQLQWHMVTSSVKMCSSSFI
jgi:hypothetical protein